MKEPHVYGNYISDRTNISVDNVRGRSPRVPSTVFRNTEIGGNGNPGKVRRNVYCTCDVADGGLGV